MDFFVGKSVYNIEVSIAYSSLLLWKAIVPPVNLLQKYNLTAKEVSKKSKNTSHTIERKVFAFRASGRPKGQKNTSFV